MKHELSVSYSQISVFDPDLENPFNDWSDLHVKQGFSWRSESVSFGTLNDGKVKIDIKSGKEFTRPEKSIRIIQVPFEVKSSQIEVASISDSLVLEMAQGSYDLFFCICGSNEDVEYELWFIKVLTSSKPCIVLADLNISPVEPLIMYAEPA